MPLSGNQGVDWSLVYFGKVVAECVEHTAFALGFLLQLIEVLSEEITNGIGRLELERQCAISGMNLTMVQWFVPPP